MHRGMTVVDGHADILYRMENEGLSFYDAKSDLHLNDDKLTQSGIDLQVFVTFVEPDRTPSDQLYKVLSSLHRFRSDIERKGSLKSVECITDLHYILEHGGRGAVLSLEGADSLNGQISVLYSLFQLGVRWVGLTWNGANSLADGVGESRGAGLTQFGKQVVTEMNQLGMIVDVSHLAWRGVEDVLKISSKAVVASHSNAYTVFPHRRNLPDELVKGIVDTGGTVGVTFVPPFIGDKEDLCVDDLMRHIHHLLNVAGPDGVALGSDFDGITDTLKDLRNGYDYPLLLDRIESEFGQDITSKIAGKNLLRVLRNGLPEKPYREY